MNIVVTGAHGFVSSHLLPFLQSLGHEVSAYPRDGQLPEHVDVVINLAGESVFGRWTLAKKKRILESRIETTKRLCRQIKTLKLYIGASAVGYYGNRGGELLTEESPPGNDFLSSVCTQWEEIPKQLNCRVVLARLGMVLGPDGGALQKMIKLFRFGLGGTLGDGKQIVSWIALPDVLKAFHFFIESEIKGAVNLTAPHPVTNREMTQLLAKHLSRPAISSVPKPLLKLVMGEASTLVLSSTNVFPKKLLDAGFSFDYPELKSYLESL